MTVTTRTVYHAELETDVALSDGSVAHVRPIRPEDDRRLRAFRRGLSHEDRRRRFFSLGSNLARTAHAGAQADYPNSLGLVATVGLDERVIGQALYISNGEGRAEVAFATAHEFQGHGLASILLDQLAKAAAIHGIDTFEAVVLWDNRRMLNVFRQSGFPVSTHCAAGMTFPTSLVHK